MCVEEFFFLSSSSFLFFFFFFFTFFFSLLGNVCNDLYDGCHGNGFIYSSQAAKNLHAIFSCNFISLRIINTIENKTPLSPLL